MPRSASQTSPGSGIAISDRHYLILDDTGVTDVEYIEIAEFNNLIKPGTHIGGYSGLRKK